MNQDRAVWIWKCPHENTGTKFGPYQWWCGDLRKRTPCQAGVDANFVNYTSGHFLGTAISRSTLQSAAWSTPTQPNTLPASSSTNPFTGAAAPTTIQHEAISPSTATDVAPIDPTATNAASSTQSQPHQNSLLSTTSVGAPDQASTNSAASAESPPQSSSLPTAIGVGIGVPLGIAVTGFLGFLFAREARLKKDQKKAVSPIDKGEVKANLGGPKLELHDEPRPFEVGGNGVLELPGTAAQIVPKF